jgi:hypothetical protein
MSSPLPPKAFDPWDDFQEHSPQLPIEYSIPFLASVEPPPFPSIFHIG